MKNNRHRERPKGVKQSHAIASSLSLLAMTLLFVLFSGSLFAQPRHLTILHFNDIHGHLEAECTVKKCEGGAAKIATLIKQIKAENDANGGKTLVLFGGDAFSGTLISSEFKGRAEFEILDALGVYAMVLGNHEFDFSLPVLKERIDESKVDVLAANVKDKKSKEHLAPPVLTSMFMPTGASIYIIGLVSPRTPQMTNPKNVEGLVFQDPIKTAKYYLKQTEKLEKQFPVVQIGLTHMGVDADIRLAEKTKGFDVIIGGHDHVKPNQHCRSFNNVPICQTPANGRYLGRLDFEIDGKKIRFIKSELIALNEKVPEDPKIASLINEYGKIIGKKYDQVIGTALTNFPSARGEKSAIGDLVADAIRETAKTEIGFINSGGLRTSIKKGPITPRKVNEVLPFDNYVVTFDLTGKEIQDILDFSISRGGGSFLQFSGVSYKIEDKKSVGVTVNGLPLDPQKTYSASTVDFITNGGDGYTMLKSKKTNPVNILVRDALIEYVKEKKTVSAKSPTSSL